MKLLSVTIMLLLSGSVAFSQTVTGSGTVNYVPKFTGASVVGNSSIFDDGTNVGIGLNIPAAKLEILAGAGNEHIRLSAQDGNGTRYLSSSSFNYPALSYHAWINNAVGGSTGEISFLDRPGTSGFAPAVRTSDILFKTAHNWNNVSYGQYLDVTMAIQANQSGGSVGIGTTAPAAKLDIVGVGSTNVDFQSTGRARLKSTDPGIWMNNNTTDLSFLGYSAGLANHAMGIYIPSVGWNFNVMQNGNVLIGKTAQTNATYMLDINGNVRANKLTVNTTGADFVFEPGYQLPSLNEVEKFVLTNHHLQGVATAKEMQEEGMELGESQTKLLQKVEELTLYTIEQDKANNSLQQKVATQGTEITALKQQLLKLELLVEKLGNK